MAEQIWDGEEWHEVSSEDAQELLESGHVDVDEEGDLVLTAELDEHEPLEEEPFEDEPALDESDYQRIDAIRQLDERQSGMNQLEALRREIAEFREESALRAGRSSVYEDLEDEEEAEQEAMEHVDSQLGVLASNLRRPLNESEAADILTQVGDGDVEDEGTMLEAASRAGVHEFTASDPTDPKSRAQARNSRVAYVDESLSALQDQGLDDEPGPGENAGMSGWAHNLDAQEARAREDRLAQSMAPPEPHTEGER